MDNNTSATHSEIINTNLNLLTPREWDVLLLVAGDISNKDIAEELHLTPESVKTYRARIGGKLMISGRDCLGRYARRKREFLVNKHSSFYPSS